MLKKKKRKKERKMWDSKKKKRFSKYENSCKRHNYSLEFKWSDYPTYQKLRD